MHAIASILGPLLYCSDTFPSGRKSCHLILMALKPFSPVLTLQLKVLFNKHLFSANYNVPATLLRDSTVALQDTTTWRCPNIITHSKSQNFILQKLHWMSNSECFLINIHASVVITTINQLCWEKTKNNAAISVAYKTKWLFLTHITYGLSFPVAMVHNTWLSPKPIRWGGVIPLQGKG